MKMQTYLSKRADPNHIYVHPRIKDYLLNAKKNVLENDWDRLYIIDGGEGSGKSLLALQFAKFLNPNLSLDQVTFSGEEFSKAIDKSKKGDVIIFDEAFNGLGSSGSTSKLNRFLVRKLMECRQKNLFIIIVLPTIFLLQKYVAVFRSKALFHVYTRNGKRGYYKVYNEKAKKQLYILGQKLYSYKQPFINKSYNFGGKYPLSEEDYRKKKAQSLIDDSFKEDRMDKSEMRLAKLVHEVKTNKIYTYEVLSDLFRQVKAPLDATNISRMVAKYRQNLQTATAFI